MAANSLRDFKIILGVVPGFNLNRLEPLKVTKMLTCGTSSHILHKPANKVINPQQHPGTGIELYRN